jgi:hypothetical protein
MFSNVDGKLRLCFEFLGMQIPRYQRQITLKVETIDGVVELIRFSIAFLLYHVHNYFQTTE